MCVQMLTLAWRKNNKVTSSRDTNTTNQLNYKKMWRKYKHYWKKPNNLLVNKPENIIVVDNVADSKLYKSSVEIKKEVNKFPEINNLQFAYSLPRGGVALQFRGRS